MRKVLLLLAVAIVFPAFTDAQTADDVLGKYFEARGGLQKIRAVMSERVSGTISFGPGTDGPFIVERKRPYKMHMEVTIGGKTLIRVYDGKSAGWIYNPFAANPAVEDMSAADLRNILDEADFEGPFIDYKAKGNQVEYAGKTTVEGKPAYKLKLTNKGGDVSYFSFDAESYMLLRWEGNRKNGDQEVPWVSYFREFREVKGLMYPFLIESAAPGTDQIQRIYADKIEVNTPIDESRFTKPAMPPSAPAAAPAPGSQPN